MAKPLSIAVRDFAVPVPRRGSLEALSGLGALPEHGAVAHAVLQATRRRDEPRYQSEVAVQRVFQAGKYKFRVTGRIDGLVPGITPTDAPLVEEIKSAFDVQGLRRRLSTDLDHPYWLQLFTYAYIVRQNSDEGAPPPLCRMTLVSLRTGAVVDEIEVTFDPVEYDKWLVARLAELEAEEKMLKALAKRRRLLGETLPFPFAAPRPGQAELTDTLRDILGRHDQALLEAPTGLGKTAGILTPVLKESLQRSSPTIYVTAKNSQQSAAEDAAARLAKRGADVRVMTLTAKHRICMQDEPVCDPEKCVFAKNYYDKVVRDDLVKKVAKRRVVNEKVLRKFAEKHRVCPYELGLDASPRFDLVIGDYNFVIAPHGLTGRLAAALRGKAAKPSLVVDEAHNLPSRAADNLSANLSRRELSEILGELPTPGTALESDARGLADRLVKLIASHAPKRGKTARIELASDELAAAVVEAKQLFAGFLASDRPAVSSDPVLRLLRTFEQFAEVVPLLGEAFVALYDAEGPDEALRIVCLDPSASLQETFENFAKVVGFSATLKPFDYYARLSGFAPERVQTLAVPSPFPRDHRKLLVIPQVSTKLRVRARHVARIADAIARITAVKPGHYAAFFPSFAFLADTARHLTAPDFEVIVQTPKASRAEVARILDRLADRERPVLLLAVQGGAFAEGLDFPDGLLSGAIIVGPAIPTVGPAREAFRDYCEERYGRGDDYAYTVPAMTRVVQAAGRVIRSEKDRGLIVLMDDRFVESRFAELMPRGWYEDSVKELVSTSILDDVRRFWDDTTRGERNDAP